MKFNLACAFLLLTVAVTGRAESTKLSIGNTGVKLEVETSDPSAVGPQLQKSMVDGHDVRFTFEFPAETCIVGKKINDKADFSCRNLAQLKPATIQISDLTASLHGLPAPLSDFSLVPNLDGRLKISSNVVSGQVDDVDGDGDGAGDSDGDGH